MKPHHRQEAEFVVQRAQATGKQIVVFNRLRDPKSVAEDIRIVAKERGVRLKVQTHANRAVSIEVPKKG